MHEVHELFRSPTLFIGDAHCRAGRSGFGDAEVANSYTVILPRSGVFVGELRGRAVLCDPNHAVFLDRHETYRVSHPLDGGDRCTVLCFNAVVLRGVLRECDERAADRRRVGFEVSHAPTDPVADRLQRWLVERLWRGPTDDAETEEVSLALLAKVVAAGRGSNDRAQVAREATRRRWSELTEEAKEVLAKRVAERVPLTKLAAELECSPYHLSRVFRARTGISVHRYHNRLRVREARERIALGERSLSRLAAELGFADHAHLCRVFRRETGCTPSSVRPAPGSAAS
jgi:AraC-like DNA-binding protein